MAEAFTGLKGVLVPIEETIRGFNMIMDGEVDEYPEAAFNLVGSIDDAIEKGKKLMAAGTGLIPLSLPTPMKSGLKGET